MVNERSAAEGPGRYALEGSPDIPVCHLSPYQAGRAQDTEGNRLSHGLWNGSDQQDIFFTAGKIEVEQKALLPARVSHV